MKGKMILPLLCIVGLVMGIALYGGLTFHDRALSPEEKILKNATVRQHISECGFNSIKKLPESGYHDKEGNFYPMYIVKAKKENCDLWVFYSEEKDEFGEITLQKMPPPSPPIS